MRSLLTGLLLVCCFASGAHAGTFYEYGPIACSTELVVEQVYSPNGHTIEVRLPDGQTRLFRVKGTSRDISHRKLPAKSRFRFGPDKVLSCTVDVAKVTGVVCRDYPTKRGWGGACDYCVADVSGAVHCRHIEGQLIEVTKERRMRREAVARP